jgi:hypothetical protein
VLGFFLLFTYYIDYNLDTTGQILMIFIYVTDYYVYYYCTCVYFAFYTILYFKFFNVLVLKISENIVVVTGVGHVGLYMLDW